MAGVKRKAPASASASAPPPPPRRSPSSSSSSSSSSSESDEEDGQWDAPRISSKGKHPLLQRTNAAAAAESESGSDSDSDSDSETPAPPARAPAPPAPPARAPAPPAPPVRAPAPAAKPVTVRQKPSESEEESSDEAGQRQGQGQHQLQVEDLMKAPPPPQPEKKKPKLSASAAARIWSQEDEIALLRALSEFHAKAGNLPLSKDHGSFFLTVRGSVGFPLTQKQLKNKIRMMKENYNKKKEKGAGARFSKPHDKLVFDMCAKLFNGAEAQVEGEGEGEGEAEGGDVLPQSNFLYLRSFVENMIREREMPSSLMVQDVIAHIGRSRAQQMNAEIKELRAREHTLRAREHTLRAREHTIKTALFDMMDS